MALPSACSSHTVKAGVRSASSHHAAPRHPRTIGANAPALVRKTAGQGYAYAPEDWSVQTSPQGNAIDLASPDMHMSANWGVVAINPQMGAYYGAMYSQDPETSIAAILSAGLRSQGDGGVHYVSAAKTMGGFFTVREFESNQRHGVVFYHVYPNGDDTYVESMYVGATSKSLWKKDGPLAVNVALSIRGAAQLSLPSDNRSNGGDHGGGKVASDEDAADSAYNAQLGTKYVHSPSTGQCYVVDPATDTWETGPDGPGVYRQVGNSYEKLEPGME